MRLRTVCILAGAVGLLGVAGNAKDTPAEPVVWGVTSHNTGCVIFEEGTRTSWMGVNGRTPVLRVVGTVNYEIDPKEWLATEQGLDELKQRAEKDNLKLIRIPEKHPKSEVTRARTLCREDM